MSEKNNLNAAELNVLKRWSMGGLVVDKIEWNDEPKDEPKLKSFAGMDAPNLDFLNIRKEAV